jgi:hypothetical protein
VWDAFVAVPRAAVVLRAILSRGQARVHAAAAAVSGAAMLVAARTAPDHSHIQLAPFALTLELWAASLFGARLRLLVVDAGVLLLSSGGAVASRHVEV